jgi:rubrerythrin
MSSANPNVLQALNVGIQSEVASYVFYLEASKKPETAPFKSILEELALEEKAHFRTLEGRHHNLVRSEMWVSTADVMKQDGLPEVAEDMAEKHRPLIDEVQKAGSIKVILDIAYRLEQEARDLFAREAGRTDDAEVKTMFDRLAKFEEGHMAKIAELQKQYA